MIGETFLDLLRCRQELDCELIIGGSDMPATFVWSEDSIITEYGVNTFRPIMEADYIMLDNGNIEILCDDWRLGEEFVWAAAGYCGTKEYKRLFGDT